MKKSANIFLILAIAAFIGIVAIFIFAGYLGIYDTVYVTASGYEQVVGPEFWQGEYGRPDYPYTVGAQWGEPVEFRYEIDNRRFATYTARIDVSLWRGSQKVLDISRQDASIESFEKATFEWTLSPDEMDRAGLTVGQYTVIINRGGTELREGIAIGFHTATPPGYPAKPVPVPARVEVLR